MLDLWGMLSTPLLPSLPGPLRAIVIAPDRVLTGPLDEWVECSPMVREIRVQSLVESYQRLKKWYLVQPCLALSITRYGSRVKGSNPLHLSVVAIEKGAFRSPSTKVTNFTYYRVLSVGQTELNCVLMLNWIVWNRTVLTFNCVSTKRLYLY